MPPFPLEGYSADVAPRLPTLKLSMYRTVRLSSGTAVPPDCQQNIKYYQQQPYLGKTTKCVWRQNISHWVIAILFVINQYKIYINLRKSSTLHKKYILNNSKHKQINASPKNIKFISMFYNHIIITGITTVVINIMPFIQLMALIQCNVTLDINYASKQRTSMH